MSNKKLAVDLLKFDRRVREYEDSKADPTEHTKDNNLRQSLVDSDDTFSSVLEGRNLPPTKERPAQSATVSGQWVNTNSLKPRPVAP